MGLEVIGHSETSSFFNNVVSKGFLDSFKGKSLKAPLEIDVISGATYTSNGILSGVNNVSKILSGVSDSSPAPEKKKQ